MRAYWIDLRERVVAAYDQGNRSEAEIAALFGIGEASLRRWRRRKRDTGAVAPTVHRKARERRVGPKHEPEKTLIAAERQTPRVQKARDELLAVAKTLDATRLVFIDESGSHIATTPDYARSPVGERVADVVPRNRGTVTTMIGALGLVGLLGVMTVEGGTDAAVFEAFVAHILGPKLEAGDIVILDNVGAHKPERIRKLVEAAGATLLFLPPYSPDLNPIEECWSKFKARLKRLSASPIHAPQCGADYLIR